MYTQLLADIFVRYAKHCGRRAVLMTGTDDHGLKIQQAAQVQGILPSQLVDYLQQRFRVGKSEIIVNMC